MQYVNLKTDVAAFDLSALLADHKARNRASELERAQKITLADRKAQAKKNDAAEREGKSAGLGGKKRKKSGGSRKKEEEFVDEDEEIEEEERQNKRNFERYLEEGSDGGSEDGSEAELEGVFQARDVSKRVVKRKKPFEEVEELEGASTKVGEKNKKIAKKVQAKLGKPVGSKSDDKSKKPSKKKKAGKGAQGLY